MQMGSGYGIGDAELSEDEGVVYVAALIREGKLRFLNKGIGVVYEVRAGRENECFDCKGCKGDCVYVVAWGDRNGGRVATWLGDFGYRCVCYFVLLLLRIGVGLVESV